MNVQTPPCEDSELMCGAELGAVDGLCRETEDLMFDMMSGVYRCPDHFPRDPYGSDGEAPDRD